MTTKTNRRQKGSPQRFSTSTNKYVDFENQRERRGSYQPMEDLMRSSVDSAKAHNKKYSRIISCYTEHAEISLKVNRRYKRFYFYVSLFIMLGLAGLVVYLTLFSDTHLDVETHATAIVSFVTAFIVLPVTITKYLFNPDETKDLKDIVKSIQEHDLVMTHGSHQDKVIKDNDDATA